MKNFELNIDKFNNHITLNLENIQNLLMKNILKIVQDISLNKKIELVLNNNQFFISSQNIDISELVIDELEKLNIELILLPIK